MCCSQYPESKYEGSINWRLFCLRGTKSLTVLNVLLNLVFLCIPGYCGAAGGRGQGVM